MQLWLSTSIHIQPWYPKPSCILYGMTFYTSLITSLLTFVLLSPSSLLASCVSPPPRSLLFFISSILCLHLSLSPHLCLPPLHQICQEWSWWDTRTPCWALAGCPSWDTRSRASCPFPTNLCSASIWRRRGSLWPTTASARTSGTLWFIWFNRVTFTLSLAYTQRHMGLHSAVNHPLKVQMHH